MNIDEYARLDGVGIAKLIADKEVTAAEVHAAAKQAIAKVQPTLNACTGEPWAQPLEYEPEGPLAGVPFALKDLVCYAKDVPGKWGSRLAGESGISFDHDTVLMSRFRKAGLATTVMTATPEFGYGGNTEPLVNGSTRNPWDTTRSVGGSSGGSGALVAAGGVPIAHANDAGGSIRIPSSYNGTVGLKPSRGLVPLGPAIGEGAFGLAAEFAITRTVRDAAAVLDQVAGWAPGERYRVHAPKISYSAASAVRAEPMRIAICTESWAGTAVEADVAAAVEATGRVLSELGHHIDYATPIFNWEEFMEAECCFWWSHAFGSVMAVSQMSGREPGPETVEASTLAGFRAGQNLTLNELSRALGIQNGISRTFGQFFTEYDVLITPTTNSTALPLGFLDHNDGSIDAATWVHKFHDHLSFTPPYNQTGLPAISLPLGLSRDGMPIGVQLGGDMCSESLLLSLAAELEEAMPWSGRKPAVHASTADKKATLSDA
ncbi:amidase [Mycolicibacterium boenickei]|nr:amidase [Mycolicibacterium boenickei]